MDPRQNSRNNTNGRVLLKGTAAIVESVDGGGRGGPAE